MKMIFLLLLLFCLRAHSEIFEDIEITPFNFISGIAMHGYQAVEYRIKNHSLAQAHLVEIRIPESEFQRTSTYAGVTKKQVIEPGTESIVRVFLPPLVINGWGIRFLIDGQELDLNGADALIPREKFNDLYRSFSPYGKAADQSVIMIPARFPAEDFLLKLHDLKLISSTSNPEILLYKSDQPAELFSTDWLSYSRFDAVIAGEADFTRFSADTRNAIKYFCGLGGILIVTQCSSTGLFEEGHLHLIKDVSSDDLSCRAYQYGFGRVYLMDKELFSADDSLIREIIRSMKTSQKNFNSYTPAEANSLLPMIEKTGLNIRPFSLVLFLFSLIAGPLNFYILYRLKKKILLIITLPAISILFTAGIFFWMLLIEGIHTYESVRQISVLDQKSRLCFSRIFYGVYSTVTSSEGMHFQMNDEISPCLASRSYYSANQPREIVFDADQNLSRSWIIARTPIHAMIRRPQKIRERIEAGFSGDSCWIINGLGETLKKIVICSPEGRYFEGTDIPQGEKTSLRLSVQYSSEKTAADRIFSSQVIPEKMIEKNPELILSGINFNEAVIPGTYLAYLMNTPFFVSPVKSSDAKDKTSIIFGILGD